MKLHRKQKYPILATSNITEVLDGEKADKKEAEICAKNLKTIFIKMKNENPLKDEFDLYQTQEWRESIQKLLKHSKDPNDMARLFNYLEIELENLWLKWSRSSYSYFSWNWLNGAWYSIKFSNQDKIKEIEINNRSKKCAENLIKIYKEFKLKNENKNEKSMRMNILSQWWDNIEELLNGVSGWDIASMFDYLSQELEAKWYSFSRPSYSYFESKNDGSAWISVKEKEWEIKKAA